MDPFNALNVACAVVQFVGFASRILKTGYDKHRSTDGASAADLTIELLTEELKNICDDLTTAPLDTSSDVLSEDERDLQRLVDRCRDKAKELLSLLQGFRAGGSRLPKGLDSVRQAVRRDWSTKKIERLQQELDQTQQQVNTVLLRLIRDGQSQLMSTLDEMKRKSTRLEIENGTQLDDMRDHLVHSIEGYGKQTVDGVDDILGSIQSLQMASSTVDKTQLILSSLRYPEMVYRQHKIHDAHTGTFDWILRDDNFSSWLTSRSDVFWITGKPGSGKSTLMKYIEHNKEVLSMLEAWAARDDMSLVTASFYFWHAGTELQRSQEGLLRSLLFQIFRRCPESMPEVLPSLWKQSVQDLATDGITWTYKTLVEAFRAFAELAKNRTSTKFCFFIDGLDEYGEEPTDLNPTLEQVMRSDNIKLCVASRPWPEFQPVVGEDPRRLIVIQEHTQSDINLFVNTLLKEDVSFQRLADTDASALVQGIIDKANGVFLWVFLVVRSLLRGLRNGDDPAMLNQRLTDMPPDLNSFFERMLKQTEPIYQRHSAVLLLTALKTRSFPLITFRYLSLELAEPDAVLTCHDVSLRDDEAESRELYQKAENYIATCCRDLLELHYTDYEEPYGWLETTAHFTHRTVGEYLAQKEVQQDLVDCLPSDSFHPWRFMTQVYIYQAKSVPLDLERNSQSHLLLDTARRATYSARQYEDDTRMSAWPLMQELARIDDHKLFTASKQSQQGWIHRLTPRLYFAVVLIRAGLALSVGDMMKDEQCQITIEDSRELLVSLFHNGDRNGPCNNFFDLAAVLVRSGLDFNHRPRKPPVRLLTAWEVFLLCCQGASDNYEPRWWTMAHHMLELGANPWATVFADDYALLFTRKNPSRLLRPANMLGVKECLQPACNAKEKVELDTVLSVLRKAWRISTSHLRFRLNHCSPVEIDKVWRLSSAFVKIVLMVGLSLIAMLVLWHRLGLRSF